MQRTLMHARFLLSPHPELSGTLLNRLVSYLICSNSINVSEAVG